MTKSALEFLFGIGEKRDELVRELNEIILRRSPPWLSGPLLKKWRFRFPRAERPLEEWAREFCDLAQGRRTWAATGRRPIRLAGTRTSSLCFDPIPAPCQAACTRGFMELQERDAVHPEWIETYLMHDPFSARRGKRPLREHPWSQIYSEQVMGELLRRHLARQLRVLRPLDKQ